TTGPMREEGLIIRVDEADGTKRFYLAGVKAAEEASSDEGHGLREPALAVLRMLRTMGATSEASAVEADKVIERFSAEVGFNIGNQLYQLRHTDPPLTARATIAGKRKATYITKEGLQTLTTAEKAAEEAPQTPEGGHTQTASDTEKLPWNGEFYVCFGG